LPSTITFVEKTALMLQRLSLLFCLWLVAHSSIKAQSYQITGKVNGIDNSTPLYLVYYYGESLLIADTAKFEADKQTFQFSKPYRLEGGLYFLGWGRKKGLELVIDKEQNFSFEADTANFIATARFRKSKDNELYYSYLQEINENRQLLEDFRKTNSLRYTDSILVKKAVETQATIDKFARKFIQKHEDKFTGKLLKAFLEPDLPTFKTETGKIDSVKLYYYHKAHFFDNIDLHDERMLRTPVAIQRVNAFFKNMVLFQVRDSVTKEIDHVMSLCEDTKYLRKNIVLALAKKYEMPTVLGLDGTYPHLLEKYYVGEPQLWDSSSVVSAKKVLDIQKPLIMGNVIPDMMLADTLGNPLPLSGVKSKYTMVYIYNPDCGACKATTPKLPALYDSLSKKFEIKFYLASIGHDPKRWKEFIGQAKIGHFLNGMDSFQITDFNKYNTYSYPTIYLLDKDKHIIAKHIDKDQVQWLLQAYEMDLNDKKNSDK
jgi:thiol-disulfide isomerase/thioredoxin